MLICWFLYRKFPFEPAEASSNLKTIKNATKLINGTKDLCH
jgi:hypothetical protein